MEVKSGGPSVGVSETARAFEALLVRCERSWRFCKTQRACPSCRENSDELRAFVSDLASRLVSLERDRERMDWLDAFQAKESRVSRGIYKDGWYFGKKRCASLREAIDKAMTGAISGTQEDRDEQ